MPRCRRCQASVHVEAALICLDYDIDRVCAICVSLWKYISEIAHNFTVYWVLLFAILHIGQAKYCYTICYTNLACKSPQKPRFSQRLRIPFDS